MCHWWIDWFELCKKRAHTRCSKEVASYSQSCQVTGEPGAQKDCPYAVWIGTLVRQAKCPYHNRIPLDHRKILPPKEIVHEAAKKTFEKVFVPGYTVYNKMAPPRVDERRWMEHRTIENAPKYLANHTKRRLRLPDAISRPVYKPGGEPPSDLPPLDSLEFPSQDPPFSQDNRSVEVRGYQHPQTQPQITVALPAQSETNLRGTRTAPFPGVTVRFEEDQLPEFERESQRLRRRGPDQPIESNDYFEPQQKDNGSNRLPKTNFISPDMEARGSQASRESTPDFDASRFPEWMSSINSSNQKNSRENQSARLPNYARQRAKNSPPREEINFLEMGGDVDDFDDLFPTSRTESQADSRGSSPASIFQYLPNGSRSERYFRHTHPPVSGLGTEPPPDSISDDSDPALAPTVESSPPTLN